MIQNSLLTDVYQRIKEILSTYQQDDDLESFVLERVLRKVGKGTYQAIETEPHRNNFIRLAVYNAYRDWKRKQRRQEKQFLTYAPDTTNTKEYECYRSKEPIDELILVEETAIVEAEIQRDKKENTPGNYSRKQYNINRLRRKRHGKQ